MYIHKKIILLLIISIKSFSQVYEFGMSVGGNNPIADIGREIKFFPNSYSFGASLKKNIGDRYIIRGDLLFHNLTGDDKSSFHKEKIDRGYNFSTKLIELSAGIEVTFWKYNHFKTASHTPYFIGQISFLTFSYREPKIVGQRVTYKDKNQIALGIPIGIGYKYKFSKFVFSLEYKLVFTTTNNLDNRGVLVENKDLYNVNTYNKTDWYNYVVFNIGFAFGRKKCFFCLDRLDEIKKYRKR